MRTIIWKLLRFLKIAPFLQLAYKGALDDYGWIKSFNKKQSIDRNGSPIPWITYPAINFLNSRLNNELNLLEFGSGNSTLWFSKRVKRVFSVEHNKAWFEKVKEQIPKNVSLFYSELDYDGEYSKQPIESDLKFNIILIDGRDRNNCVFNSIDKLTEDGIYIFDNSQRERYLKSQQFLKEKGFKRIDFKGMCPGEASLQTTTVFYKNNNCLGI
jgi:hypothetical protein